MPLTRPIPEAAYPVLEIIRAEVPKPSRLPISMTGAARLRWKDDKWDFPACPMGLHRDSTDECPDEAREFAGGKRCGNAEFVAFADWFDEQTDAQAAVDAIWKDWTKDEDYHPAAGLLPPESVQQSTD